MSTLLCPHEPTDIAKVTSPRLLFTCRVYGTPASQGSKRHVGRGIMIESSKKLKPWREAVKFAALEKLCLLIDGPVTLSVTFYFLRPKTSKRPYPSVAPDLSKLIRSTEDALTDVGVWYDDALVVSTTAHKRYCPTGQHPGALIEVWSL